MGKKIIFCDPSGFQVFKKRGCHCLRKLYFKLRMSQGFESLYRF